VLPQQQSSLKNPDNDREVFRSVGSIVLSWAWLVVAVIALIDLAVQGRDHAAAVTALAIVAISAVVYGCAWRPRIVADSSGITVANPLRDHQVPWAAVSNVDVVNALRVHATPAPGATSGKIIYSWAVQASPTSTRRAARRAGLTGQRPRLARRYGRVDPPPGATRGYGQIPEPAKDALDRTSAEFTAGRLAERAQHARQALVMKARAEAGQHAPPEPVSAESAGADPLGAKPLGPESLGTEPAGTELAGTEPAGAVAGAGEQPVARWAWGPIAAMVVPIAILIIVAFI